MSAASQAQVNRMYDREAAIRQYAPLVKYVVGRLAIGLPSILDYEDILSYGTIGLIEALDRFDDTKGVKFETYAISRIRGAIIDALRALDRLPRSVRQKVRRLDQVTLELSTKLGREPTEAELAEGMGMTREQFNGMLVDSSWVTVSLDGLLDRDDNNDGPSSAELPADPNVDDFTGRLEKRQLLEALTTAVKNLPEREWLIVSLYYHDEMTMKEIAQILDISESRVCQLHGRALGRLRARLARDRAA
ncbi:MAG: FliA/WhiG family RNA polymerase sigma factor [Dehalococcoidia bacterium]|nr:FliA/WhiG family RNA polymerase sigma factor [Chloroflexi bacterium CFX7]MCK6564843.1 FliA/WhiG family RNA polymerase sigma factor [Dehalococcoidia bacterium]MCL4230614.1 FliA/WhiG family RNA polymerase sigma factor [Dehalococcoidia bacterium]NUQ56173.1 FliA/WhiG family RNA polymerase sigma factor [Dehalococcoidia bacterium]RIL02522.1 MAG: RNA polymerase sigma factor WhiG [bacterium]